jgi:hypothetical protein
MKKIRTLSIYPNVTDRIYNRATDLVKSVGDNSYLNIYANDFLYQLQAPIRFAKRKLDDWFYLHEVLGHRGKKIKIIKIRTMVKGTNGDLIERLEKSGFDGAGKPNDNGEYDIPERVFLRDVYLDEIFQVIHILQGHMQVVDERPRPEEMWEKEIELGLRTREEMEETLDRLPGLYGIRCLYPELPAHEARKKWGEKLKKRPGSLRLDTFLRINRNIIKYIGNKCYRKIMPTK